MAPALIGVCRRTKPICYLWRPSKRSLPKSSRSSGALERAAIEPLDSPVQQPPPRRRSMSESGSDHPVLFLSHAGVDAEPAFRLKERIEQAPQARARNLKVWFDKDDLRSGESWQQQLEEV